MIFRVQAQGDTVYIYGDSLIDAMENFSSMFGEVPENLMEWYEVPHAPKDEEVLFLNH